MKLEKMRTTTNFIVRLLENMESGKDCMDIRGFGNAAAFNQAYQIAKNREVVRNREKLAKVNTILAEQIGMTTDLSGVINSGILTKDEIKYYTVEPRGYTVVCETEDDRVLVLELYSKSGEHIDEKSNKIFEILGDIEVDETGEKIKLTNQKTLKLHSKTLPFVFVHDKSDDKVKLCLAHTFKGNTDKLTEIKDVTLNKLMSIFDYDVNEPDRKLNYFIRFDDKGIVSFIKAIQFEQIENAIMSGQSIFVLGNGKVDTIEMPAQ